MRRQKSKEHKRQLKTKIREEDKKLVTANEQETLAARVKHAEAMEIARRSFRRYAEAYKALAK